MSTVPGCKAKQQTRCRASSTEAVRTTSENLQAQTCKLVQVILKLTSMVESSVAFQASKATQLAPGSGRPYCCGRSTSRLRCREAQGGAVGVGV